METEEQRQGQQELEQVRRNVEQWRQTRVKQGAMPAPLWEQAAAVARMVGTYRVARDLSLNYRALKQRAFPTARAEASRKRRPGRPSKKSGAAFVEIKSVPSLSTAVTAVSEGAVVEVVAADGARLTIRLKSGTPDLAALVASFR